MNALVVVPGWVPWVLAVVLAAGVVLSLPVEFRFRLAYPGSGRGEVATFEFSTFGGLAVWRLAYPIFHLAGVQGVPGLVARLGRAIEARWARARGEAAGEKEIREAPAGPEAHDLSTFFVSLAEKVRWSRLTWDTTVGLPDAAATALTVGALWALKGNLAALATRRLRLAPGQPRYSVTPDFDGKGSASVLDGIGALRVGHIILASPGLARGFYQLWKQERSGGRRRGPSRNASGRRRGWSTPFKA